MFNVKKSDKPTEWTTKDYRDPVVVEQMRKDFHGKCYICEQKNFSNLNVEHFKPHKGNEDIKLDWYNLYFSCSRCNSIKNKYYEDMLDCCNREHLVEDWIKIYYRTPDEDIEVINACPHNHEHFSKAETSKNLIASCFNNGNSGVQEISKENLREKIIEVHSSFLEQRLNFFRNLDNWLDDEKIREANKIKHRLQSQYEFSAILRGYIEKDRRWRKALEDIELLKEQSTA